MAFLFPNKSQSKSVKNSARKTSCWEEILESLKEFAEKIERNDGNIKHWQVLADNITSKTQQAVKGINPGSATSRNSSNNDRPSQGVLDDLLSKFCWVFFETAIDVKLVRKLHKGAVALSELCPKIADIIDCQFVVLISEHGGLMNNNQTSRVSNLLEGSQLVHSPLARHFPQFLTAMNRTMTSLIAEVSSNIPGTALHPEVTACCSTLSKLALQMCQLVPLQLGGILDGAQDSVGSRQDGDLVFQLSGLVGNLVIMMCSKKFSRENGLMSGCAVGMLFNSSPTPKDAVSMAINLLHSFHQGSSQPITDFNSDLGFFNRLVGPPFQDFSPPEKAFGALCLARGLITCGDVKILLERIPTWEGDNEGQIFLIGPLLTVTQELLSSVDTPEFHSIQLFTLWLQCVHRHLRHLRSLLNNNAQRFLTRTSDVVQLVLSCIWRHWHSPIDGVPEQIRALFSSLLDSYKAESHLLNSADTELLTYLAQELLGSPVHLKGRYALLSTLIPHLGATAVLDLHPGLSNELLSCLDTHHLVFAANETYKTLISGIKSELAQDPGLVQGDRKEEFKETALTVWAKHFQEVVIIGLSSNNALVRNNMANTWLPATFKIFPETFPLLLDVNVIMRGGHNQEARNLHRKIILLKQARTCKILKGQEWMQHHLTTLEEAANHHDDDIRGDTIYLVCHSPRTAEPVGDDETKLVKTLVKNCLTTDDTSLRNQLRISMKALIFRLRDSSLAWLKKINSAMAFAASSGDSGTRELSPATKALQTNLQSAVDLMDWLLEESFSSLFPGACYQRKRASLDLLRLIYENLAGGKRTDFNNASSAALSAASKKLLSWSRDIGKVDLFSERNASLLVNSLLDSSNDIRSSAYDLLIGYFPWPLPSSPAYPWSSPSEILVQGMKLICSPKFHECEAGAMLCKLSFHRQIVESQGLDELAKQSKNKSTTSTKSTKSSTPKSPVQFVFSLMESLRYQFKCAKINILQAAALTPMHGIIMAIRKCLTEDTRIFHWLVTDEPETWQAIVKELNTMLHQIIKFILDLLAGQTKQSESKDESISLKDFVAKDVDAHTKQTDSVAMETESGNSSFRQDVSIPTHKPDTMMDTTPTSNKGSELRDDAPGMPSPASKGGEMSHLSPSFGKMGEEIEKLVTDFGTEDDDDEAGTLSLEHQLIFSCCWLTLKESSLLMGALAEVSPPFGTLQTRLLDKQQFELMSKSLVQILTKCRHKGALEGCKIGFFKVCAAMLSCPDSDIASIPKSLLDLVLTVITTTASSTSYTKKSAGLPPLVESIIVAEPRGRERHLLKYIMTKLMEIAQQPLPSQPDAKQDLPQSHALNIMKSLFVNSALAWEVLPYAEEAVQVAIDGFASSNWMVQNSSMQLLGSLIARIFGQKRVQDEHSQVNTLSASEFFQRYPRLRLYLLQEVRKAAALHQHGSSAPEGGRLHLIPTLHPVLLVLTKLGSGITTQGQKMELEEFIEPICSLASSPIYSVRDLASRAILPLLSQNEDVSNMAAKLLDTIPPSSTSLITNQNRLHGNLLMIQRLLTSTINKKSMQEDKVQELTDKFMSCLWVGSSRNPCPITRAQFIQICTLWWENAFHIKPDCVTSLVIESMNIHQEFFTSSPSFQVGLSFLGQEMTTSFISMSKFIPDQIINLSTLTRTLLTHDLPEVRELTLKYLIDNMTSGAELSTETHTSLQLQVLELLLVEDSFNCLTPALDLWVGLSKDLNAKIECDLQPLLECLLAMTSTQGSELSSCAAVLPALSVALRLDSDNFKTMNPEMTLHWCDLVLKCSDPSQCETVRLSAAKSLKHSGVQALNVCDPNNIAHCDLAFMIMKAGILLLQDEQPEIREEAARFSSLIPREGAVLNGVHVHCSTGLKNLLDFVCAKFCINIEFLDTVISLLIGDAFIVEDLIYEETHSNSLNLFEQESVNMYAEGIMEANLVFHAVKVAMTMLMKHKANIMRDWISDRWHFIQFNMASLIKYLDKHPVAANSFYAGTGHSKPYQAIYRLLMYVWLLQTASMLIKPPIEGVLQVKQKIDGYLKSMQKMYYVFPLLKESIPTNLIGEELSQEME